MPLSNVILGAGSFSYFTPPFNPSVVVLNQSEFHSEDLIKLENDALIRGSKESFSILASLGNKGD